LRIREKEVAVRADMVEWKRRTKVELERGKEMQVVEFGARRETFL